VRGAAGKPRRNSPAPRGFILRSRPPGIVASPDSLIWDKGRVCRNWNRRLDPFPRLTAWTACGGRVRCSPPKDTGGVNGPAVFCGVKRDAARVNEDAPAQRLAKARPGTGGVCAADEFRHSLDARSPSADRVALAEATRIPSPQGSEALSEREGRVGGSPLRRRAGGRLSRGV
jgi:hypothetical protein